LRFEALGAVASGGGVNEVAAEGSGVGLLGACFFIDEGAGAFVPEDTLGATASCDSAFEEAFGFFLRLFFAPFSSPG
jgi:hypothetical protein